MSNGFGTDPIPGIQKTEQSVQAFELETMCLSILNGPGKGRIFKLDKPRILIGRNDPPSIEVDIDLTECELGEIPVISRRHAEIIWNGSRLEIVDLCSTNGTWANGKRLTHPSPDTPSEAAELQPGSEIRLANIECKVELTVT